jgi:hypothetical protein
VEHRVTEAGEPELGALEAGLAVELGAREDRVADQGGAEREVDQVGLAQV